MPKNGSADDEDLEVILDASEGLLPGEDGNAEIQVSEGARAVGAEDGIAALQANLDRERREKEQAQAARAAADQRAREAEDREAKARGETTETQLSLVTNAIDTVKASAVALKANLANALRDQDFEAAAEVQEQMANNAVRLQVLERGKVDLEETAKNPPPQIVRQTGNPDPVEAFLENIQITPRSANWLRSHRDYVTDPKLNRKMIRAHEDLMDENYVPDSDSYFEAMEARLGVLQAPAREERQESAMSDAAEPARRREAPPAAPVSRGGTGNGSAPTSMRLTPAEREMAEMSGMTNEEWAKNKAALIREGKLVS